MAKFEAIQEGNWEVTYAKVREDGSLLIQARYFDPIKGGVRGVDEIELLPEGVSKLKALLTRSAELRNEVEGAVADDAPKSLRTEDYVSCPRCAGTGKVTLNSGRRYPCGLCDGSGQLARIEK